MNRVKEIVHANDVYKMRYTGKGVRIALLDTGAFLCNELKDRVIYFKDYVNGQKASYDDNGHGTHIAGIICANGQKNGLITGMAPGAELMVFKILDKNGNGSTNNAIKALDWIIRNHKKWKIRILNFSMGYLPNANPRMQKELLDKLERLWDEGVIVVTAAGNNGPKENTITVPGISRKVITVGSSDDYTEYRIEGTGFGGRGPTSCCIVKPEILAPGSNILSLSNVEGEYTKKSGTSMSVPIVCGALALALEKSPDLKPVELKLMLYDTVDRINHTKTKIWGILNVDNLVKML